MPTRGQMVARIMAYDICAVARDLEDGDLSYLAGILTGEGWTQYSQMSDEDVAEEWFEGDYDGLAKLEAIRRSPLRDHRYVAELMAQSEVKQGSEDPLEN
jgi:hypothetical protein